MHAPAERNTHTPWRQKSQEAGGEGRKSKKKVGGREGKEVGKEGKKSGCGRKGQRAGLKHQEGSRERSQHLESPCWWSLWSRGWGEFSAKGYVITE